MARDLIPPPSPAGRSVAPGTPPPTHQFVELPPEPVAETPAPPRVEQKLNLPPTQYRNRFGFLAGALGGVVLGSIALAIAVFAYSDSGGDDYGMHPNWSAWQPADETLADGAKEIAAHVGAQYKHPNGDQLLQVKAVTGEIPLTLQASTITDLTGDTVIYQMDGLGEGGSITGEASIARGAVVFREALELSLYTFRYLPDAEGVMVMIPPPPADPAEAAEVAAAQAKAATDPAAAAKVADAAAKAKDKYRAIYFRPGDLKSELQVPLGVTVPAGAPNAKTITQAQADDVNRRVRPNLFTWEQNLQTGALLMHPMRATP
ncbi:hypothetical protein OJ998_27025 [Solirubrobacter taibaiensis]|nr:hypothetical protein [Solirubrobacter taibaiensis]